MMPYCTNIQGKRARKSPFNNKTTNQWVQMKTVGHAVFINIVHNDVIIDFTPI